MKTKTETRLSLENLSHLPSFAKYLLESRLDEYVSVQIGMLDEVDIPMIRFFKSLSHEQLFNLSKQTSTEFLTLLAANKAKQHIEKSIRQWLTNQLPVIQKHEICAEDITMVTHLRKRSMMQFIPDYCTTMQQMLELVKEIDFFHAISETSITNAYIDFLKEDISKNTHFIEKVNHTIPGAVYVFDVINFKGVYSNHKLADIIGYDQNELNEFGENAIEKLLHPDDYLNFQHHIEALKTAKDRDILVFKYRVKDKNGTYRWLSNYESVFKRDGDGKVLETIGISLNIDAEEVIAEELKRSQGMYKQAEALTQIGNYSWDLRTNEIKWSDELYRIYGITPVDKLDPDVISQFNHPDDKDFVAATVSKAIAELSGFDFDYRVLLNGTEKILHARGEIITDNKGEPIAILGTAQDVTEKQNLITELEQKEFVYKQAEELANMGNWSWDVKNNKLEWTDQLYRIYGLEPQSEKITIERFYSFIHPDDIEYVKTGVEEFASKDLVDNTFRIYTANGTFKILRSVARVQRDAKGEISMVVGTERDITEKQTLIDRLRKSENLYKQAQSLAHLGNWSWDIRLNQIEWSDELYKIYGMEPGGENLSYEKYISRVHPDDVAKVRSQVEHSMKTKEPWEYTHRLISENGEVRIVSAAGEVLVDEKGEVYMMIGTAQDITERQELINQLQQSDALYKQAQALAKMGNFVWDLKTDNVTWSDEIYKIYELPVGQHVTFQTAFEPIIPAHQQIVQQAIEETIQFKEGRSVGYAIKQKNGGLKYINLETYVTLDETENVARIIGTAQDVTEKQELIEKLQESEKLFRQAQSMAHLGNWSMDIKTREFTWSDEMYKIFEIPNEKIFTMDTWAEYLHKDEKQEVLDYYEMCVREKKNYDRVHRITLANGKIKTIHRKGQLLLDDSGEPVKMMGTTQDVTEEYKTQQELRDNQTFIRKITDATPSIIASYNVNTGEYVFISEGLEKLLGYDTRLVMEKGLSFFADIIHPDDVIPLMEINNRALEDANAHINDDSVIEFTYRMRHQNGEYKWFHTYGAIFDRNKDNKVEHVLNISLDVTDQVEATQKIKEQEHFIQQIADASPTILYLYDVDSQSIMYINREIFFVLGYLPEEILSAGAAITENLYHPEDYHLLPGRKQSNKSFQQVDSMIQYECRMKNKEHEWRWLLVREIVFKTGEDGNIKQILGAALDISRRKDMEKTILQNTMLLEQSNASLEEFAYVASHDLKEPLRKISTFGDRLVATQMDNLAADGKLYLQKIVDASQRMQTMINDLLSISMIKGNTSFEIYSLQKILDETLQTLEFKIEQLNALVKSDPLPDARIIASQFRQLFQNLLSNSLKFVRPDVQPVITIKHSFVSMLQVTHYQLAPAPRYHKIEISDNGIGFENEFAGKIFAIFQRLHGRSEYEGSGIGLAICKKIVEHHGGIIYATGIPDQGATFTIILPA